MLSQVRKPGHHIHSSQYKSHAGVNRHKIGSSANGFADGPRFSSHSSERQKEPAFSVGRGRRKNTKKFHDDIMNSLICSEEEAIISAYDSAGKGYINQRELRELLKTLSGPSEPVEPAEVNWIMFIADKDKDSRIVPGDIPAVKAALIAYLKARRRVRKVFDKYDISRDGILHRNEVKNMLVDLNDGLSIGEDELTWVLDNTSKFRAGALAKPEVEGAISFWYNNAYPPEEATSVKDRRKGGVVGRAMSGIHRQKTQAKFFPTELK